MFLKILLSITLFLPFVAAEETYKGGIAASSTRNITERVETFGFSFVRGWQLGGMPPTTRGGVRYVPNLWCNNYSRVVDGEVVAMRDQLFLIDLLASVDYDGYLLFLNEPDLTFYGHRGQCEITPHGAAILYLYTIGELPNAKLLGPGVSHIDYLNGWSWTMRFIEATIELSGSPPDFYAWDFHTYLSTGPPLAIIDGFEYMLSLYGITNPIFTISEWGNCDPYRLIHMKEAFDNDDRVYLHAIYTQEYAVWDGVGRCILLTEEGVKPLRLTQLGVAYKFGVVLYGRELDLFLSIK